MSQKSVWSSDNLRSRALHDKSETHYKKSESHYPRLRQVTHAHKSQSCCHPNLKFSGMNLGEVMKAGGNNICILIFNRPTSGLKLNYFGLKNKVIHSWMQVTVMEEMRNLKMINDGPLDLSAKPWNLVKKNIFKN